MKKRKRRQRGNHPYKEPNEAGSARSYLRALQNDGWMWSETTRNLMINSRDPEQQLWYDPVRAELFFSPKLLQLLDQATEDSRSISELTALGHDGA